MSNKKGGVAILTREPFSLLQLHHVAAGEGQVVVAELLGFHRPLMIGSLYRHDSDKEFDMLHHLSSFLDAHNGKDFLIGLDGNSNMTQGPVFDMFSRHHALCGAHARHTHEPIDGIWMSPALTLVAGGELPGPSDHTIATVSINMTWPKNNGHTWRFSKVRRLLPAVEHPDAISDSGLSISSSVVWEQGLSNLAEAWQLWSQEAEAWLISQNRLTARAPERLLGSRPTVVPGGHHMAPMQNITERRIRRHIRRLDEIIFLCRRGRQIPNALLNTVQRGAASRDEARSIRAQQWGPARAAAQVRLQAVIEKQSRDALSKWTARVHTLPGACQWLRQDIAIPFVVKSESGDLLIIRNQAVESLRDFWTQVFGIQEHQCSIQDYCQFFSADFPPAMGFEPLPDITIQDIRQALRRMKGRASLVLRHDFSAP